MVQDVVAGSARHDRRIVVEDRRGDRGRADPGQEARRARGHPRADDADHEGLVALEQAVAGDGDLEGPMGLARVEIDLLRGEAAHDVTGGGRMRACRGVGLDRDHRGGQPGGVALAHDVEGELVRALVRGIAFPHGRGAHGADAQGADRIVVLDDDHRHSAAVRAGGGVDRVAQPQADRPGHLRDIVVDETPAHRLGCLARREGHHLRSEATDEVVRSGEAAGGGREELQGHGAGQVGRRAGDDRIQGRVGPLGQCRLRDEEGNRGQRSGHVWQIPSKTRGRR
ncbi:hypothetical protein ROTAS13_04582 [Roseomonas sp. TAS13]|nr:hypothetical protein ROTAS13_04582 [Roseomonas sp. TAS13]